MSGYMAHPDHEGEDSPRWHLDECADCRAEYDEGLAFRRIGLVSLAALVVFGAWGIIVLTIGVLG